MTGTTTVVSSGCLDVLVDDTEALVLTADAVLKVSALAAVIVQRCAAPVTVLSLAAALVTEFGPPEGADLLDATCRVVTALIERELLITL